MNTENFGTFLDTPKLQPGITRFWFIRHALVEENARMKVYGAQDVPLCPDSLIAQKPMYEALAARLPQKAVWLVSPLSRTHHTAKAIQQAGYGSHALITEPGLIEQSMGEWHGTRHEELPGKLSLPSHLFWSLSATERPPGGESMMDVAARVATSLNILATQYTGREIIAVSHGGTIRAALAHALKIHVETALHFSIQNLSLTIIEHYPPAWRIVTVNELPGI
ncbi:histidine phosphatase family protein [Entomobacter blattae]|uniref:Phosphoglycerate mutase GpmB n=1 Tax=Entomobacter blattae TaxID=2762277 RepID=A0A7H1NPN0_9PROT|nr:histidine phosphatase family protein [Entomobacter blattae]QNT77740.1 phosphoglycerate mutase GpmB [Entomobacter blattae]